RCWWREERSWSARPRPRRRSGRSGEHARKKPDGRLSIHRLGDLSAAAAPSPTLLSSPGRSLSSELVGRPAPAPEPAAAEDRGGQRDRIASAAALSGGRPPRISRALESAAPASGGGDADRHRARRSAARRGDLVAADVY